MIEKLRTYFVEVMVKKMGPSAIKGAIAMGLGIVAAHEGVLKQWGISADAHKLIIDLDILGNWVLVAGWATVAAGMTAAQHHTVATIAQKPQSGDLRQNPEVPIEGGERPIDPPKGDVK